jgi:hypothetical protein
MGGCYHANYEGGQRGEMWEPEAQGGECKGCSLPLFTLLHPLRLTPAEKQSYFC